jgi:poly-gamma-glutamate synthesis protein (capsule biosynthesis protein)
MIGGMRNGTFALRGTASFLFIVMMFPLLSCGGRRPRGESAPLLAAETLEEAPTPPPPPADFLSIVAVGDMLYDDIYFPVLLKDGVYDFTCIFDAIKPYTQPADIAFANQETVFVEKNFSGYPAFGGPTAEGDALIDAGFDVVNHATNHALDRGERGLRYTMAYWDAHPEVQYLGVFPTEERSRRPVIINKNNISVGFLAYTYGLNGIPLPTGAEYIVSLIDKKKMAAAIDELRPQVDVLAVSMHWGNEYETTPSKEQKALALFLAEHNVDLIIGHHPHVLQPVERLPRKDGGETLCFYSLGNFTSLQVFPRGYVLLGGLMYVKYQKDDAGLKVDESGVVPVVNFFSEADRVFTTYPLQDYTQELADRHWNRPWPEREIYGVQAPLTVEFFHKAAKEILGDAMMLRNPFGQR